MAESIQSLDQLSQLKTAAPDAPKHEKKVDKFNRAYATGKRKDAVARVWIKPGAGKVTVNSREVEVYFARPVLRMMIEQPPATPAWSSARSTARPRPAGPSSSRSVNRFGHIRCESGFNEMQKGADFSALFVVRLYAN